MQKWTKKLAGFCLAWGIVGLIGTARAGIISSGTYTSVGTAGNASATVITSPPTFHINSLGKSFTSIGPLDVAFPVTASGGPVTYLVTEGITNNTTQTWSDYHEILGAGTAGTFVQGGPVNFLLPIDVSYTNPSFTTRAVTATEIDYTGGTVLPGQAISITYSITIPDAAGPYSFTLRQLPSTVPEPTCLAGLGIVSTGLLTVRRRRM